jgi:hypothetical protein
MGVGAWFCLLSYTAVARHMTRSLPMRCGRAFPNLPIAPCRPSAKGSPHPKHAFLTNIVPFFPLFTLFPFAFRRLLPLPSFFCHVQSLHPFATARHACLGGPAQGSALPSSRRRWMLPPRRQLHLPSPGTGAPRFQPPKNNCSTEASFHDGRAIRFHIDPLLPVLRRTDSGWTWRTHRHNNKGLES